MSELPTVFCPKEGKDVPVWHCLGSFVQRRERCPHMIKVMIWGSENRAEVECDLDDEPKW